MLAALAIGCRPQDEIARYTVPKPELIDPTLTQVSTGAKQQQMLAAIVLLPETAWFFKLTGDPAVAGKLNEDFITFVKSLKFSGKDPTWSLPAGWKQLKGNQTRFATIEIPGPDKPLELSVTSLSKASGDDEGYVLVNVNRWRGQLNLTEISAEQLGDFTISTTVDGHECVLVNLIGTGSGSMGSGPFAGGPFSAGGLPPNTAGRGSSPESKLSYTKPESWTDGQLNEFRKAAFDVKDGDKTLLITVTSLPPSPLLANVQRWGLEVGIESLSESDLAALVKKIEVAGTQAEYVELIGPPQPQPQRTILGVIVPRGELYWFIKLKGDAGLAQREKSNFESFVKSLKFE
jgi:hypothetical protein